MGRFDHLPPITDEEEARIQAGIAADPDNPEWTDEELANARPAREVLPPEFFEAVKRLRGQRGKQKAPTKEFVSIRIDRDVVAHFKKGGPGWQTRLNNTLKKAIAKKR
ncbi:MAG: BrnA antitoxin family protein [Hyphomicrobiales bacterium]|nr:BrnA antitoxin family protein [Hyphomicrobiales bacterium]